MRRAAVLAAALGAAWAAPAAATDPAERVRAAAAPYVRALEGAATRLACGADALCTARGIAAALGAPARLEPRAPSDSDTIRWARSRASLGTVVSLPDGRRLIVLRGFGRTLERELAEVLADAPAAAGLVIDLRGNPGGDFGRMLRLAGWLIGPRRGAVVLYGPHGARALDLPALERARPAPELAVLVDAGTASSAEVLAALLRRHAGAEVLGTQTAGKDYLLRVVPVDRDWRLLLPAERIVVPGETLRGGLVPDRALPPALLATTRP